MKLFLVHITNLAVVMHLTFGCNWHHGINSGVCCSDQNAMVAECCPTEIEPEPSCCDHDESHAPSSRHYVPPQSCVDQQKSSTEHGHFACVDDGCEFNTVTKLEFDPIDFSAAFFDCYESLASANKCGTARFEFPPDFNRSALKLRPHLILGVQLL